MTDAGPVWVAATVCHTLPSPRRKVSVAVRGTTDVVYGAAVTVTVLLPTPLSGLDVSHAPSLSTVHAASPGVAVTVSDRVPPAAPNVSGPTVTGLYVAVAPACVTTTVGSSTDV
jgi:hypothetical protein